MTDDTRTPPPNPHRLREPSARGVPTAYPKLLKYLPIAFEVAKLSKDTSTKAGALVIGPDGESGPWGYNGAVRGCSADEDERWENRDTRLMYAEHAERNAIYAAARSGFSVKGCSIVVTHFPCVDCARAIIQSGITTVVCPTPTGGFLDRWFNSIAAARGMFTECGVRLLEVGHDIQRA
jgi:dCMP deaminase